jgi:hypothetical protein
MPTEPIDLIASRVPEGVLDTRTGLRRDILLVFNIWHNEPLTAEIIKGLLETKGHSAKMETLYDNLETLVRKNILIKKVMPSAGFKGRPPYFYEINRNAVYDQFELLEDLLDACGFDPIDCDESGNAFVVKPVCIASFGASLLPGFEKVRSIRNAFDGGEMGIAAHLAESEDFEKTWRLEQFIKTLQERCKTDSPAYIEFREDRDYQELVKAFDRRGMLILEKKGMIHKKITIHGMGPLICHVDKTNKLEDQQEVSDEQERR